MVGADELRKPLPQTSTWLDEATPELLTGCAKPSDVPWARPPCAMNASDQFNGLPLQEAGCPAPFRGQDVVAPERLVPASRWQAPRCPQQATRP